MKIWVYVCCIFFCLPALSDELKGEWKYKFYIYDGQNYPPSNPDLDMRFKFTDENLSILRWQVIGETQFCERHAIYELRSPDLIYQKIVWVHPDNHSSCGADPDMQLGRQSITAFAVEGSRLQLKLELNGKPYIYIFEKLEIL